MNHPTFANPGVSLTSTNFGQVTGTAGSNARVLQFAATNVSFECCARAEAPAARVERFASFGRSRLVSDSEAS